MVRRRRFNADAAEAMWEKLQEKACIHLAREQAAAAGLFDGGRWEGLPRAQQDALVAEEACHLDDDQVRALTSQLMKDAADADEAEYESACEAEWEARNER